MKRAVVDHAWDPNTLRRLGQRDVFKFEASLGYTMLQVSLGYTLRAVPKTQTRSKPN